MSLACYGQPHGMGISANADSQARYIAHLNVFPQLHLPSAQVLSSAVQASRQAAHMAQAQALLAAHSGHGLGLVDGLSYQQQAPTPAQLHQLHQMYMQTELLRNMEAMSRAYQSLPDLQPGACGLSLPPSARKRNRQR
jgi:hypothetical protein